MTGKNRNKINKKYATFSLKESSIDALTKLCKEVNEKVSINISKSEVIDMLIQDATCRDITKIILHV